MKLNLEVSYKKHLEEKTGRVEKLLSQAGLSHLFFKIIPSPVEQGYRNRAKFKIFNKEEGIKIVGTDPIRGDIPFEQSIWILPEWGRDVVKKAVAIILIYADSFRIDGFEIQMTHGRKQAHINLFVKRSFMIPCQELSSSLLSEISQLKGVAIPSQKADVGDVYLQHRVLGVDLHSHYDAFFQSNLCLTPVLIENIKTALAGEELGEIMDLYCGSGIFSMLTGDRDAKIIGVDNNKKAVESARMNARRLGFKNAEFTCASVEKFIEKTDPGLPGLVFVDPPRSGSSPAEISEIAKKGIRKICLISCYLETYVRDLIQWQQEGFDAKSFAALDMFPFTDFLETTTFLEPA